MLVIGVDIGTSSTKGVLVTPDGDVLATATRAHGMSMPRPGWAEMDAEDVWWGDVVAVTRELTEAAGDRPVAAVCVSGVGPCLLLTDAELRPVRPAILYGIDMRATAEIEQLTEHFGAEAILARGMTELTTQAVGPKLAWVRRHEPEAWQRARRWFSSNSYVVAKLTGAYVLDHHTASQCDPLYDMHRAQWADDWLAEVAPGLPAPRLAWPGEVVGHVLPAAAAATGLAPGTPVCAGTVDAWAEALSAGVRRPGDRMLMYGSTMFFVHMLATPAAHPGMWNTAGVYPGTWSTAAGMSTSGTLTDWVRRLTGGAAFEELVAAARTVPPGSDGLVLLPYFAGERTPIFDPRARGVVAGLTLNHGPGHLFRAAYEGIAYGIRQILDLLDATAGPAGRTVAVGGGTQGGLWTQIVSDVSGREQVVPAQAIGASYGDAQLAAIGAGLAPADADWAVEGRRVIPDPANHAVYAELAEIYDGLYPATRAAVHRLAAVQEDAGRRADAP
nr:FGGY-family carbohydrate kinase [Dactylosporangium thailandense]